MHVLHDRTSRARRQPLSRFRNLRAITLCRVFGNKGDPAMAVVLRQLPASLEVSSCLVMYVRCDKLRRSINMFSDVADLVGARRCPPS